MAVAQTRESQRVLITEKHKVSSTMYLLAFRKLLVFFYESEAPREGYMQAPSD